MDDYIITKTNIFEQFISDIKPKTNFKSLQKKNEKLSQSFLASFLENLTEKPDCHF